VHIGNSAVDEATCFLFVGLRDHRLGILGYQKKIKIEILKKLKKLKNTPRIRFFHLKMQHDSSKCPKFSSEIETEYKRLTFSKHYCDFEKSYKTEPF
jgi:hypothetical protein